MLKQRTTDVYLPGYSGPILKPTCIIRLLNYKRSRNGRVHALRLMNFKGVFRRVCTLGYPGSLAECNLPAVRFYYVTPPNTMPVGIVRIMIFWTISMRSGAAFI